MHACFGQELGVLEVVELLRHEGQLWVVDPDKWVMTRIELIMYEC